MTITDHIGRPLIHSSVTKLSVAGAICYPLWGCLHLQAAYVIYHVGAALEPGMVQRRVFQDASVFWCDGHCRRSDVEYPKQCVGRLQRQTKLMYAGSV